MRLLFNTTGAINGYDQYGHFLRAWLLPNSACTYLSTDRERCPATRTWATASRGVARPRRAPSVVEGPGRATYSALAELAKSRLRRRTGRPSARFRSPSVRRRQASSGAGEPSALARRRARPARHDDRQAGTVEHGRRPVTRRRAGVIASSPVLVGAITTLIVILAVFLAYNANNGLPFVPTYRLSALVPNANTLVKGNDVRIGGVRVGIVEKIEPVQDAETGEVYAKVDLKLDKSAEPVPKDSTVVVRSRSALGLKYLEINKGTSSEGYAEGSTLPLEVAHPEPVEIDEFFNIFDPATRRAAQANLVAFGNALAGRGPGPERGLRRAPPPGHPPGAGGPQPRLAEDRGGALLPRAGRQRGRGGAGRRDPGSDVRLPRVHLRRLRRGGAPVHPGVDLGGAAHLRHADPDGAANQELPRAQRHACSPSFVPASRRSARARRRSRRRSRPAPTCCPAPRR